MELLLQKDGKVYYNTLMATFVKSLLIFAVLNLLAIVVLPELLSMVLLALSIKLAWLPFVSVYNLMRLKTNLEDSVMQFN